MLKTTAFVMLDANFEVASLPPSDKMLGMVHVQF